MKLIKAKFEILESQGLFKDIEVAARTCYKSEDKITDDSAEKMVKSLEERGHTAMLEHGTVYLSIPFKQNDRKSNSNAYEYWKKYGENTYSISKQIETKFEPKDSEGYVAVTTNYRVLVENGWLDNLQYQCEPTEFHEKRVSVRFTCDRGVSHEFVRHRVFSFAQESTRYCNYSKNKFGNELTFIKPLWLDDEITKVDWNYINTTENTIGGFNYYFLSSLKKSEDCYFKLLKENWSPQQARAVLPNSLKTELVMTGFASNWNEFFILRDAATAHPQAFELAHPLHEEFIKRSICW